MTDAVPIASGSLRHFIQRLGAHEPTPGGGAVAALQVAIGASLGAMVIRYTAARKQFADRAPELEKRAAHCDALAARATEDVDRDVAAYGQVSAAYRLPKGSDDEKRARSAAIQAGLKSAMAVPMEVALAGIEVLETIEPLIDGHNPHVVSDLAAAADNAIDGVRGGLRNVAANLNGLKDEEAAAEAQSRVEGIRSELRRLRDRFAPLIENDWPSS